MIFFIDGYELHSKPSNLNHSVCIHKRIYFSSLLQLTKPDMLYVGSSLLQYSDWRGHTL